MDGVRALSKIRVDKRTFVEALAAEGIPASPDYNYIPMQLDWARKRASLATATCLGPVRFIKAILTQSILFLTSTKPMLSTLESLFTRIALTKKSRILLKPFAKSKWPT